MKFLETIVLSLLFCLSCIECLATYDSDKPSMDKIFFLVKWVNNALLKSQVLLDDEDLFGPMKGVALVECKDELAEDFGESYMEWSDELLTYVNI